MLSELFLIVRPEERQVVETAIQTVAGAVYTTVNVLGRGAGGGLQYTNGKRQRFSLLRPSKHAAVFLPKVAIYLVIPNEMTDLVLDRVGAALRISGGPEFFARGLGIVAPAEREIEIGAVTQAPAQSNRRNHQQTIAFAGATA